MNDYSQKIQISKKYAALELLVLGTLPLQWVLKINTFIYN